VPSAINSTSPGHTKGSSLGVAPRHCAPAAEGPAEAEPNGPYRRRPNLTASARRPAATRHARPNWQEETVRWPGSSARPGGGDADPDPTLACSRAAHRGGLDLPLRRLTAIRDDPRGGATRSPARPRQTIRSADGALSLRPSRTQWSAADRRSGAGASLPLDPQGFQDRR
jgi:hypothetical protein